MFNHITPYVLLNPYIIRKDLGSSLGGSLALSANTPSYGHSGHPVVRRVYDCPTANTIAPLL